MISLWLAPSRPDSTQRQAVHEDVRNPRTGERARTRTPQQGAAGNFSRVRPDLRAQPALDPADAAACGGRLLARASVARGSPGARARGAQRHAGRLDVAVERRTQGRSAGEFSRAAPAVPREGFFPRGPVLLRLRADGFPPRL